jgi:indolepyruvate ferredoxin oxidoreductase alpha subunit
MDLAETRTALKDSLAFEGPSLIISRYPCSLKKFSREDLAEFNIDRTPYTVSSEDCIGCKSCLHLGCPAISFSSSAKKASIDPGACAGCGVCSQVCPKKVIRKVGT